MLRARRLGSILPLLVGLVHTGVTLSSTRGCQARLLSRTPRVACADVVLVRRFIRLEVRGKPLRGEPRHRFDCVRLLEEPRCPGNDLEISIHRHALGGFLVSTNDGLVKSSDDEARRCHDPREKRTARSGRPPADTTANTSRGRLDAATSAAAAEPR
jgi:hypothetical protein